MEELKREQGRGTSEDRNSTNVGRIKSEYKQTLDDANVSYQVKRGRATDSQPT